MLRELALDLVDLVFDWGYLGVFLLMVLESSFIPFPSEVVLIPAGYLISQEKMNIFLVFSSAVSGSLVGGLINYYLAFSLGRKFLLNFGKYFFIKEQTLVSMELFFEKHGAISTFTGRLIPGIRQLISIPAGLSKMNIVKFSIYTSVGAGIWALVLIALGYFLGENETLIHTYLTQITVSVVAIVALLLVVYFKMYKKVA